MRLPRLLLAALLGALCLAGAAQAQTSPRPPWAAPPITAKPGKPLPSRADTHVYLLRGLFGVFSQGIDALAAELVQLGYTAEVHGWDEAQTVIDQIVRRFADGHDGPVVVIGHSLGANATIAVASAVAPQNIPVDLAVTFDATDPGLVPENVAILINFWANDGFGKPVSAGPGYTGQLENFDLSGEPGIDHTSIDTRERFHQFVITTLEGMTGH
ncbi:alpha/beta hydrolase [Starkeya koreensis]|uniref:Alpha/beta hydrolase n=1 Tax=Ancylobacter koreensis TaxID=266121 RepID=A0ABT0DMQ7_9HYPH|nr:alpha/beta hydrolase [Ancylobacter koreensis]MCK0208568.1 alpha/beta hydrolase [Ancylobacter koreensis]